MECRVCGKEIEYNENGICNKCQEEILKQKEKKEYEKRKKLKFHVRDVVNKNDVINKTNRVAYITSGWALQVRNTGIILAVLVGIFSFLIGVGLGFEFLDLSSGSYESFPEEAFFTFLSTFGTGLIYAALITMVFNTVAFIIRMGAEVIQLLDDIKNKK